MEPQDISLAICGHAWHGKSTLLGKIVAEAGMATQREVDEAHRAAKEGRDPSLVFAQLVFRSKDVSSGQSEAARGVTILPSIVRFEFPDHRVTVIDTPGQETYTNNRFFGMFQADTALLVIDCKEGIRPITRQVLRILKGFEIPVHGVALTKMDKVGYEESAYDERVDEVRLELDEYGIDYESAPFIPVSAYAPDRTIHDPGEGVSGFDRLSWYDGPCVRDFLRDLSFETIRPPERSPLRLVIHGSEVYDHVPGVGKTATALVESGVVRPETQLKFEPTSAERGRDVTARVRSVQLTRGHVATPGVPVDQGIPRQLVGVAFKQFSTKEPLQELFKGRGVVAGETGSPPRVARRMEIEVTVFDPDTLLSVGGNWTLHAHVDRVAVQVDAILAKRDVDATDWEDVQEEDAISAGEWGKLHVSVVTRPVAIEEAGTLPPLSKFVLRKDNQAVAYGRCTRVLE